MKMMKYIMIIMMIVDDHKTCNQLRKLLPIQENYTDPENRIIEVHRTHLTGPIPSVDHSKVSLRADAQDLVVKKPYSKQNSSTISKDTKRSLIEMEKYNLFYK